MSVKRSKPVSHVWTMYIHIYIYIYLYMHNLHTYIYIYYSSIGTYTCIHIHGSNMAIRLHVYVSISVSILVSISISISMPIYKYDRHTMGSELGVIRFSSNTWDNQSCLRGLLKEERDQLHFFRGALAHRTLRSLGIPLSAGYRSWDDHQCVCNPVMVRVTGRQDLQLRPEQSQCYWVELIVRVPRGIS